MTEHTGAKLHPFGAYQPDRVVTNADLAQLVDTDDEWITSRVGIKSRRIARDDETVTDMAEAAGAKALAASGLEPAGRQGLGAGHFRHVGDGLVVAREPPGLDTDPLPDPLVVSVHDRGEIVIGHHPVRLVAAERHDLRSAQLAHDCAPSSTWGLVPR